MAFEKINTGKNYIKYKTCEEGQVLVEGIYIGRSPNTYKPGDQFMHFDFRPLDGDSVVVLPHAGGLEYKMREVPYGYLVRVTFDGRGKLETGRFKGKDFIKFNVEIDYSLEKKEWVYLKYTNQDSERPNISPINTSDIENFE